MKKHSCGAILYTIYNSKVYLILGLEKGQWFPFKGTREKDECNTKAAIREIYEETYGTVKIDNISLDCNFSTKRKHYHIGLVFVPYFYVNKIFKNKILISNNSKKYNKFLEKTDIKLFSFNFINKYRFHAVTQIPLNYYYNELMSLQNELYIISSDYIK